MHKKTVVACVLTSTSKETRTFGTMTHELLEFVEWLEQERATHVAMESTGVYWKPVFNLLEGHDFELLVVNARHTKAVPGRKTDVKGCRVVGRLATPRPPARELRPRPRPA